MAESAAPRQTAPPQHVDPQRSASHRIPPEGVLARPSVSRLQQMVGNRAIHRLLRSSGIQPQLTVGPADDEYEREADRVADEVMRMSDPSTAAVQRAPLSIQRMCPECEEEEAM
jgi:hypothetical protein